MRRGCRVMAVMASALIRPGVRCSPQARALAAIASRVASSSRASMVGSSRRTWHRTSPTGLGRDTHQGCQIVCVRGVI